VILLLAEIADEPFSASFYAQRWRFDDRRLRQELGYEPNLSLAQTIHDTVNQSTEDP
jgi:nucleoside-diphosphate-sugar epimerase